MPAGMLPPPPLGTRPEGLLALLGIQAGGRYPQHLGEDFVPVADLIQWYLEQEATYVSAQLTIASAASIQAIGTVPATEQWLLRDVSMTSTSTLPGGVTEAGAAILVLDPATVVRGCLISERGWVGGRNVAIGATCTPFRIIPPGWSFRAIALSWAGVGSPLIDCTIRYVPLPR